MFKSKSFWSKFLLFVVLQAFLANSKSCNYLSARKKCSNYLEVTSKEFCLRLLVKIFILRFCSFNQIFNLISI